MLKSTLEGTYGEVTVNFGSYTPCFSLDSASVFCFYICALDRHKSKESLFSTHDETLSIGGRGDGTKKVRMRTGRVTGVAALCTQSKLATLPHIRVNLTPSYPLPSRFTI